MNPATRLVPAVAIALVVVLAGCGVRVDERPRALDLPETTTTVPASPSTGRFGMNLYFVGDGSLYPVVRDLPDRTAETLLTTLIDPPSGVPYGLGTSIPAGTTLLDVTREGGRAVVDLSESFDNVVGPSRQQAIGQIVLTLTELVGVESVRFRVEGQEVLVSSPLRGDSSAVGACDFFPLLAGLDDALDRNPGLPISSIGALNDRISDLSETCPGPQSTPTRSVN